MVANGIIIRNTTEMQKIIKLWHDSCTLPLLSPKTINPLPMFSHNTPEQGIINMILRSKGIVSSNSDIYYSGKNLALVYKKLKRDQKKLANKSRPNIYNIVLNYISFRISYATSQ